MARTRPGLTRDAILAAALSIIDENGLEACTMPAVAAELGVEAMSLYWHVPGKDALLDGVVERVLSEVAAEQTQMTEWRAGFLGFGHVFRGVLLRHPNTVHPIAARPAGAYAAGGAMAEDAIDALERGGFERPCAIRAMRTTLRVIIGLILLEVGMREPGPPPHPERPVVADVLESVATDDPTELFRFGLETLMDGLEARLRQG